MPAVFVVEDTEQMESNDTTSSILPTQDHKDCATRMLGKECGNEFVNTVGVSKILDTEVHPNSSASSNYNTTDPVVGIESSFKFLTWGLVRMTVMTIITQAV